MLLLATLRKNLRRLLDPVDDDFVEFGATRQEAYLKWSAAVSAYGSLVAPISTTGLAAAAAFASTMAQVETIGTQAISNAFHAYAVSLAAGMAGFVATPPPAPPVLNPVFLSGLAGVSGAEIADAIAAIVHPWMLTGTATPVAGGPILPWS